jgi:hypothetical protein
MRKKVLFNLFVSLLLLSNTQATTPFEGGERDDFQKESEKISLSCINLHRDFLSYNYKNPITLSFQHIGGIFSRGSVTLSCVDHPRSNGISVSATEGGSRFRLYPVQEAYCFYSEQDKQEIFVQLITGIGYEEGAQLASIFIQNVMSGKNVRVLRREAQDGKGLPMDLLILKDAYYLPNTCALTGSFLLKNDHDSLKWTNAGLKISLSHTFDIWWKNKPPSADEEEEYMATFLLPNQTMETIVYGRRQEPIPMLQFLGREKYQPPHI